MLSNASMRRSFVNHNLSIPIKVTFFPKKGIVAQRTRSTTIPHIIICYLPYKMKKQCYRKKQVGVMHWVANCEEALFLTLKRLYFIFVYGMRNIKTAALDATMACLLVPVLLG